MLFPLAFIYKMSLCNNLGFNVGMTSIRPMLSYYSIKNSHINELKEIKDTS